MKKMNVAAIILGTVGVASAVLQFACVRAGAKADERLNDLCSDENWPGDWSWEDDDWSLEDEDGEE